MIYENFVIIDACNKFLWCLYENCAFKANNIKSQNPLTQMKFCFLYLTYNQLKN